MDDRARCQEDAAAQMAGLSSNSRWYVAKDSGHTIQWEDPERVMFAIRRTVAAARRNHKILSSSSVASINSRASSFVALPTGLYLKSGSHVPTLDHCFKCEVLTFTSMPDRLSSKSKPWVLNACNGPEGSKVCHFSNIHRHSAPDRTANGVRCACLSAPAAPGIVGIPLVTCYTGTDWHSGCRGDAHRRSTRMQFQIDLTQRAADHIRAFRKFEQRVILDAIQEQLQHEPALETRSRKHLGENELSGWELRVQKFRVFYDVVIEEDRRIVKIRAVGHKEHNALYVGGREVRL